MDVRFKCALDGFDCALYLKRIHEFRIEHNTTNMGVIKRDNGCVDIENIRSVPLSNVLS